MPNTEQEAARFLMQATLGSNYDTIQQVKNQGISNWLEQQLNNNYDASDSFHTKVKQLWRGESGNKGFRELLKSQHGETAINGEGNNPALPYKYYFRMAWWHRTLAKGTNSPDLANDPITETARVSVKEADDKDLLRHRIAQALSEILVVSDNSILELDSEGLGSFYDILYRNALGSYKTLLKEVTMHPCMGVYLSHMNNVKGDKSKNIHPDENYAREIMQLFSIGLFELEKNAERKKNLANQDIPTYDNNDIKQLARVFTGLKSNKYSYEWPSAKVGDDGAKITFGDIEGKSISLGDSVSKTFKMVPYVDMVSTMTLDDAFHDKDSKSLLKGRISLAAGNTAQQDIDQAVEGLVGHPSTAPFICRKLIQQLVTSNPTPEYIQAVAEKFGTAGDLKAAVRETLLYPQSNPVTKKTDSSATDGTEKLKSPLLRVTQILRAFGVTNDSHRMWVIGESVKQALSQHPLSSPTVFNFYKPDFVPHGKLEQADKVAPEFELHNSSTSIAYVNMIYDWLLGGALPLVSTTTNSKSDIKNVPELDPDKLLARSADKLKLNLTKELELAADAAKHDELIDRVSLILCGKTNLTIKPNIKDAFKNYDVTSPEQRLWIVQTVIFMVAISPDFVVLEA